MKLLTLLFLLAFASCKPSELRRQPDECRQLQKQIKAAWVFNEALRHYQIQDAAIGDLLSMPMSDCLGGLSREAVIYLFGNPSREDDKYLDYHLSPPCATSQATNGCRMIRFTFGSDGLRAHAKLETLREN